ncbi:MAG: hypothetical protein QM639_19855 [Rhodocyclaceae bacterium]
MSGAFIVWMRMSSAPWAVAVDRRCPSRRQPHRMFLNLATRQPYRADVFSMPCCASRGLLRMASVLLTMIPAQAGVAQTIGGAPLIAAHSAGADIGRYGTVSGTVFLDNGAGGGVGNNGRRDGGEIVIAGSRLRLTDCAPPPGTVVHASGSTDEAGRYALAVAVPVNAPVCMEQANRAGFISTGVSLAGAPLPGTFTYVRPADHTGTLDQVRFRWTGTSIDRLDFGDVADNVFASDGAQHGTPNSTVTYHHSFTAATTGIVSFSVPITDGTKWHATIVADPTCAGAATADGAQAHAVPMRTGLSVNMGDRVCVVLRQFIPGSAVAGDRHIAHIDADFIYANAGGAIPRATYSLEDVTSVGLTDLAHKKHGHPVMAGGLDL